MGFGNSFSGCCKTARSIFFRQFSSESRHLSLLFRFAAPKLVCTRSLRLMYIELHARSAFSFLEGASVPEEFVQLCTQRGMPAMALLDRDGVYGSPRFHGAAKKCSIRAHVG